MFSLHHDGGLSVDWWVKMAIISNRNTIKCVTWKGVWTLWIHWISNACIKYLGKVLGN